MTYLTLNDYYLVIQDAQLQQLIGSSGTNQLDLATQIAMATVKSYLIQKYDMDAEYAKTGDSRDLQTRLAVVDVALYLLHSRISPNNIPELRQKRYDQTISWLKDSAKGNVTPALTEIDITTTGARIRFGNDGTPNNKY